MVPGVNGLPLGLGWRSGQVPGPTPPAPGVEVKARPGVGTLPRWPLTRWGLDVQCLTGV